MIRVGLFFEDEGHRGLLGPLCERLADLEGAETQLRERNVSGGAPRALSEVRAYARDLRAGHAEFFEVLVVAVDGNCSGPPERRAQVERAVGGYPGDLVVAVPDPHVECWYLADTAGLSHVLEQTTPIDRPEYKCERGRYKRALREAFASVGVRPPAGGAEFGSDIAAVLDLDRAAQADRSFGLFVSDFRAAVRRLSSR